tara:strand:- start:31 stop:282 length:252 start_codon:yes stop_codon:yes gene_type:complete
MAQILDGFPKHLEESRGRVAGFKEEWFDGQARCLDQDDLIRYKHVESARSALVKQCEVRQLNWKIAARNGKLYFQVVKDNVTP